MNVLNAWSKGKTVWLEGRDRTGNLHVQSVDGVDWYFCVDAAAYDASDRAFWKGQLGSGAVDATVRDGEHVKVYSPLHEFWHREQRKALFRSLRAQGMEPLEGDLALWERYLVDHDVNVDLSRAKVGWWDIETDDRAAGVEPGRDQVISVAIIDAKGNETWLTNEDEKVLLEEAMSVMREYDVLVSWGGQNFDLPTMKKRAKVHKLDWKAWRVAYFDLMMQMQTRLWFQRLVIESWALDYVARRLLGRGKIERVAGTWDMWQNDRETLKEYNLEDCRLTRGIDTTTEVTESILAEAETCGVIPRAIAMRRRGTQYLIDGYILRRNAAMRRAGRRAIRLGTPEWLITGSPKTEAITGATVLGPALGLHENVYLYDFSALYPTTIEIWNISPETLTEQEDSYLALNGTRFLKEPRGMFPEVASHFKGQRQVIKDQMETETDPERRKTLEVRQYVYKGLVNAIYGALAQPGGRHYNRACAEAITFVGRDLMERGKKFLEGRGHTVVFGDTDSLAFVANSPEAAAASIDRFLAETQQDYHEKHGVVWEQEMRLDAVYRRFLMVSKKRHAGWQEGTDDIDAKGLEYLRRETISLTKRLQRELLINILAIGMGAEDVGEWIRVAKSRFFTEPPDAEDITIRKSLSKRPNQYQKEAVHVNVARQLLEAGESWVPGKPVAYIVTDFGSPQQAIPAKLWDGKTLDRAGYWNHLIWPALERVLESAFPGAGWDAMEAGYYGRLL